MNIDTNITSIQPENSIFPEHAESRQVEHILVSLWMRWSGALIIELITDISVIRVVSVCVCVCFSGVAQIRHS